jgi:RimJ/RimL family protein N-acetyltransferase
MDSDSQAAVVGRASAASERNDAESDRPVSDTVVLRAGATPCAPSLVLRPWRVDDVSALVAAYRDPVLRRWTSSAVESEADAVRWVRVQRRGWAAGNRFSFAVLEEQPDAAQGQLVANLVLKKVTPGKSAAEVGYWTAAHARGRSVAPRALDVLTTWAFNTFGAGGLKRLDLLHQVDNSASCRVAHKSGYAFDRVLPATPPAFPLDGHLHTRHRDA